MNPFIYLYRKLRRARTQESIFESPKFREGIRRGLLEYRQGEGRPWSEVKAELGL
jgi:hypothetical protein